MDNKKLTLTDSLSTLTVDLDQADGAAVSNALTCGGCLEVIRGDRSILCGNGHYNCLACIRQNGGLCTICKEDCQHGHLLHNSAGNKFLGRVAHAILGSRRVACRYAEDGCSQANLSYGDLERHEKSCLFGPRGCPMILFERLDRYHGGATCRAGFQFDELLEHCFKKHSFREARAPAVDSVILRQTFREYSLVYGRVLLLLSSFGLVYDTPKLIRIGKANKRGHIERGYVLVPGKDIVGDIAINLFELPGSPRYRQFGPTRVVLGAITRAAGHTNSLMTLHDSAVSVWPNAHLDCMPTIRFYEGMEDHPILTADQHTTRLVVPQRFLHKDELFRNNGVIEIRFILQESPDLPGDTSVVNQSIEVGTFPDCGLICEEYLNAKGKPCFDGKIQSGFSDDKYKRVKVKTRATGGEQNQLPE